MDRNVLSLTALCAALFGSAAFAASSPALSVTMNPRGEAGARISVGGVQLVKGTRFTVHSPGWTVRYVRNISNPRHVKVDFRKTKDGIFESVTETVDNVALLDEYSVVCRGGTAVITTRATMHKDTPALIETVYGLAPWVCENARYEVTTADGRVLTGRIPEEELGASFEGSDRSRDKVRVLPPFVKGRFSTRRGIVTVEVVEGPALKLDVHRLLPV